MMERLTAEEVVEHLGLAPLPEEGGMYRQTYCSGRTLDGTATGTTIGTAIYFLLTGNSYSHLHRLQGDEVYHFYMGDPVELLLLFPDGASETVVLGHDLKRGQVPQFAVPAGVWQGSYVQAGGEYALLGTTMAPGFIAEEYEHADAEALKKQYPGCAQQIERLTGKTVFF